MGKIKRLPTGISQFRSISDSNLYYVDKTMYLPKMEAVSDFLFFIRPRRFGKSLFLSMVADYYDCENYKDIDEEFQGTWIAEHPLETKGKFQVLSLDFSQVAGCADNLQDAFHVYLGIKIDAFLRKYGKYYSQKAIEAAHNAPTAGGKIAAFAGEAKEKGYRLYLIIDEYDNFTNVVLNEQGHDVYHEMTHGSGFYRDVFKTFKPNFTRILFMGVSPITLDDLTSGFNIATNISIDSWFNDLLGFSETDVRKMISYYQDAGMIKKTADEVIAEMKPWYDNYCFAEDSFGVEPSMYNSNMVIYYMSLLIRTGRSPKDMRDPNSKTDYAKMKRLVRLDRLDGDRKGVVRTIAEQGYIDATIETTFPAIEMINPNMFVSLLFYYGMLTIGGTTLDKLHLVVPNLNVWEQYYRFLFDQYQDTARIDMMKLENAFTDAALKGDWQPLFQYLSDRYFEDSSVRDAIGGEKNVQGYFMAYLNLSRLFVIRPELEFNHGYCDFFLLSDTKKFPVLKHSYVVELKYLKADAAENEAKAQWHEAEEQVKKYLSDESLKRMTAGTQMHGIILQFQGGKLIDMGEVGV